MKKGTRVTPAEVLEMQRLFAELGSYTAVGKELNRSASTVSKYVQMKGVPQSIRLAVQKLSRKG